MIVYRSSQYENRNRGSYTAKGIGLFFLTKYFTIGTEVDRLTEVNGVRQKTFTAD